MKQSEPSGFQVQVTMLSTVFRLAGWVTVAVLVIWYLSTAVAQVKVQETGVLLRLGKIVRPQVDPGLCLKFPWPIDRLETVETRTVKRLRAGFGADPTAVEEFERVQGPLDQIQFGSFWIAYGLTGDKNIIHIKIVVSYLIDDPVIYLYDFENQEEILRNLTQLAIINNLSGQNVDDVLTTGKLVLQKKISDGLIQSVKSIKMGVNIIAVEIKNVRPPGQTSAAFKNVINAQEEMTEALHQAESYQNRIIPEANAEAEKVIQSANAYKTMKVDHARGEAKRFEMLIDEYEKNPELTRERIRLETLEEILPKLQKFISDSTGNRKLVNMRILSQTNTEDVAVPEGN